MANAELVTLEQVEDVLLHGGEVQAATTAQVQRDIAEQILQAESLEVAFGEFKSTPVADIEGILLTVDGIAWVKSGYEEGPGIYALCKCTLVESKQEVTVSMGGFTTMCRLVWAMRNDAMPIKGCFVYEDSAQDNGKRYLTFKLAPKSAK